MTNSILIGKVIYSKLNENEELNKIVNNKIFPLIAEQTTTYPFVIYYRTNVSSVMSNKDGFNEDKVFFSVVGVSQEYTESLEIANLIRKVLEKKKIVSDSMVISDCKITGIDESYEDNSYVQRLNFECTVN